MIEKFTFNGDAHPTMALIAPDGAFSSPTDIVFKAASRLKDEQDIANFGRELTAWTANHKGIEPEEAATMVGGWISYTLGHMGDDEIESLWQRSIPQTDVSTGFMPDNLTLRVKYSNAEDLARSLSAAAGRMIEEMPTPLPENWPKKRAQK